ncbi:D-alanyl-D-alanine carboxypeptidase (penicillin-binding protein 5/6) [Microbacterium trichothecenolyticum]|uniref:D-alanyl-D-alanine carboxypeptidase family protein n=1 Tax=Microbacterium trichothecenolyticum TaxID=69370 RepID=UPI00285D03EF|nr:D-alanyl-D-alanine carboxypeptidase [Microbacterium trichothecenolyticum]MDR7110577.1 D-alanyl-D-alanine carboxypeptidase (penicillin-binding protein 5/6) [Microbacterium trichothecenolyticum]
MFGGPPRRAADPEARRRRRRIGWIVTAIVLVVLLAVPSGYVWWALTAPVSAPLVETHEPPVTVPAAAAVALPSTGASAIAVAGGDEYLGAEASGIWATSGTSEPQSIASITKVITALVILDRHPLADAADPGPTITFSKADHDLYDQYYVRGATIAAMPTGSSMSLHDALATMLIPSASNYAEAVSTWAFGSQGAFRGAAQRWLAANGLTGTTIVEPTGLDARNTSTPADLIALGKLAAANPVIASIVATRSLTLPGPGAMQNTNDLLGSNGITGLKTGNLGEGTYNLLFTAFLPVGTAQPLSVTGVVLGGFTRANVNHDVMRLIDSIRAGFHEVPVAKRDQPVGTITTRWGESAQIVVSDYATIFTWSDTPITVEMTTTTPKTYTDGEEVGSITWTAGPNTVTVPIEIEGTIVPPTDSWRLTHPGELGGE